VKFGRDPEASGRQDALAGCGEEGDTASSGSKAAYVGSGVMKLENVVRFSSHPRPFLITETYCSNPDCHCNEVFLNFTEVGDAGGSLKNALSFSVRIDLDRWQESEAPRRSPEVVAWVQEFLNQCPSTRRTEYRASYEEGRRIARRKAEYMMDADEVLEGALVSYNNILTEKSTLSAGGNAYTFDVHCQGREYLVEDRYCPNPHCDCQAVHLEFFEAVSQGDAPPRIYQRFLGRATFAGTLVVEERGKCTLAEAKAALSAWWTECRDELKMLKDRYREVKEIGRRSLNTLPSHRFVTRQTSSATEEMALDEQSAANAKVRRNAPCPCGSGKKYKKCCWRKAPLPL
jgi:hypothetical protein